MKRKIITLAICVACLMALLASCSGTACEAHVDADKNSACDNCGIPVVTIVEKVPTDEEVVDMVVATIPAATLGDIKNATFENDALIGTFVADKNFVNNQIATFGNNDRYVQYYYDTQTAGTETTEENWPAEDQWTGEAGAWTADGWKDDDKFVRNYAVYDLIDNKNVITYASGEFTDPADTHINSVTVNINGLFFVVNTRVWTSKTEEGSTVWSSKVTDSWYFLNGTKFLDEADVAEDETFYTPILEHISEDDSIVYYSVDDTVYAIDTETYAILATGKQDTFVPRPDFEYKTETLGVSIVENNVYFYDLSKWIECVYSYEVPEMADMWILANGNLLVQEHVVLHESAVNYDFTDGDIKFDLVHSIVDVAAKEVKNVELGYYVDDVIAPRSYDKDTVKNILEVLTIKNKNLDKVLTLACDDALAILGEDEMVLPGFVTDIELVADGVFLGTVVYGDNSTVSKLYDATGKELATLPANATIHEDFCIENDGKYYDFTMKLIFDPKAAEKPEDQFNVLRTFENYIILSKGVDTYYWNAALAAPVCVADLTNVEMVPAAPETPDVLVPTTPNPVVEQQFINAYDAYFIVKTTTTTTTPVEGAEPEIKVVTTYALYNSANTKVLETETSIDVQGMPIGEDIVWLAMSDGVYYFVK